MCVGNLGETNVSTAGVCRVQLQFDLDVIDRLTNRSPTKYGSPPCRLERIPSWPKAVLHIPRETPTVIALFLAIRSVTPSSEERP